MFIECKKCTATYKIEDDRIPHQKSFVRCSSCSSPIPLPYYKVNGNRVPVEGVEVECDQCSAQYAIPFEKFSKNELKVKCGKCGFHFLAKKNPEMEEESLIDSASKLPDLHQKPPVEDIQSIDIPTENSIEMEHLFDDLNQEPASEEVVVEEGIHPELQDEYDDLVESKEPEEGGEKSANQSVLDEYLDSVELSQDDLIEDAMEIGTIPGDQKYRFFMKPVSGVDTVEQMEGAINSSANSLSDAALKSSIVVEEVESESRKRNVLLFVLLVCLCVVAAGWYYFQVSSSEDQRRLETQRVSQTEVSDGLFKVESVSANTLRIPAYQVEYFVLTGEVEYLGGIKGEVSWLEMEAVLLNKKADSLASEKAYAGNILNAKQLKEWKQTKIRSFLGYNNGREMVNMKWKKGKKVPFQLVFFSIPENVEDFQVKVSSYFVGNEKQEL